MNIFLYFILFYFALLSHPNSRVTFVHLLDSEGGNGGRFGNATGGGQRKPKEEAASSSSRSDFIEPLPSSFSGMFGEECSMYRLHGNVPQNVRQTVYKEFCKAKSGVMLCTGETAHS